MGLVVTALPVPPMVLRVRVLAVELTRLSTKNMSVSDTSHQNTTPTSDSFAPPTAAATGSPAASGCSAVPRLIKY